MRIIDWKGLKTLLPYSRTHIKRLEDAGEFPQRVQLGPCRVGWVYDEVIEWIEQRCNDRSRTEHTTPETGGDARR